MSDEGTTFTSDDMSISIETLFSLKSLERLSSIAGNLLSLKVDKVLAHTIRESVKEYLATIFEKFIVILDASDRKIVTTRDVEFLVSMGLIPLTKNGRSHIPNDTFLLIPTRFATKVCRNDAKTTSALKHHITSSNGFVFTAPKTFKDYIRQEFVSFQHHYHRNHVGNIQRGSYRLGSSETNNVVGVLQILVESYVMELIVEQSREA